MPYITSVERMGIEKGRKEGLQQGEAKVLLRLLSRRYGTLSPTLVSRIQQLSAEQLDALTDVMDDFCDVADLEQWLAGRG